MFNNPQCPIEEIELIPHPMDAWRAALTALIACAPGDGAAIAAHLAEARGQALVFVDRTYATPGVTKMVDRLMLLGAGKLLGQRLNEQHTSDGVLAALGFTQLARAIGEPPAPQSAHRTASPSSVSPQPQNSPQANGGFVAAPVGTAHAPQPLLPGEAPLEPEHSPALPTSQSDRS